MRVTGNRAGRHMHFKRRDQLKYSASMLCIAIAGFSVILCPSAQADDLALSQTPSDLPKRPPPPLSVFGDNMPDPGHLTISFIPTFGENAHTLIGTHGATSAQVVTNYGWYWDPFVHYTIVPQAQFLENQTVTLAYGIMKDWSIVISAGTAEKHSHLVTFYNTSTLIPRGTTFPGTDGLADTQAALIWRAYEDSIHRIKFNLGMSFPTGSDHNVGGAVLATNGSYSTNLAYYGMQSGTGTFDVLPGIMYCGTIFPWSWGLSYRARLPLGVNPEGYMWGNFQEANAWIGYSFVPGLTATFRTNFNIQSQIVGADGLYIGKLQSANPLNYGGKMIQVFAGADIDGKLFGYPGFSLGLEGGVPVYRNLNGPQLSRVWQAGMALRWRVGEEGGQEHKSSPVGIFQRPGAGTRRSRALDGSACRRERRLHLGPGHKLELRLRGRRRRLHPSLRPWRAARQCRSEKPGLHRRRAVRLRPPVL